MRAKHDLVNLVLFQVAALRHNYNVVVLKVYYDFGDVVAGLACFTYWHNEGKGAD